MLKIRMQRVGRINQPSYRVVVTEHTASTKAGKFVEKVGTYAPRAKSRAFDTDRIKYWLGVGAKPSDTVYNMLVSAGILTGKKKVPEFKKVAVAEAPAEASVAAAPEAAAETTEEAVA